MALSKDNVSSAQSNVSSGSDVFDIYEDLAWADDEAVDRVFDSSMVLWNRDKTNRKPFKLPLKNSHTLKPRNRPIKMPGRQWEPRMSFLSLPLEVRIQIYEYALPETPQLCGNGHARGPHCEEWPAEDCIMARPGSKSTCHGYAALLCTNRTVHAEAVDVLYSPIRSHVRPQESIMKFVIARRSISLCGFSLFCSRHWKYRSGLESMFARLRHADIDIIGEPDDLYMYDSDDENLPDENQHDIPNQVRDHVEWTVGQLQYARRLGDLTIRLVWDRYLDDFNKEWFPMPTLEYCKLFMQPFERLRHVPQPKILRIHPYKDDIQPWRSEGGVKTALQEQAWKSKLIKKMQSHDAAPQPGPADQAWNQFMSAYKRAYIAFPHMQLSLRVARRAREKQDMKSFISVVEEMEDLAGYHIANGMELEDATTELRENLG